LKKGELKETGAKREDKKVIKTKAARAKSGAELDFLFKYSIL